MKALDALNQHEEILFLGFFGSLKGIADLLGFPDRLLVNLNDDIAAPELGALFEFRINQGDEYTRCAPPNIETFADFRRY